MVDKMDNQTGIYIHVPFCRNKCDYCNFYSIPVSPGSEIINSYVERLVQDIKSIPKDWFDVYVDSLYFGGGTPSILTPSQIKRIADAVSCRFVVKHNAEITIEMNPEDCSADKINAFVDCGINRIVLGVQSLDANARSVIGRRGGYDVRAKLDLFSGFHGFTRCIDLITGIPGQSANSSLDDLKTVSKYRPEHISLYLLSIENNTPLAARLVPDDFFDEMQAAHWGKAIDFLAGEGYSHYEVSNFSLPGFESVHNSKYWHFVPYAGFGAGAHSFTGERRYSNSMTVEEYIKSENVRYTIDERSESDVVVEFFMTALRDLRGFTISDFERVTGRDFPCEILSIIENFIIMGDMSVVNGKYVLTRKGLFNANRVIYKITEDYIR